MGGRGELLASPPAQTELIDFTIERQRHRRFVGREDVLAQLDEWLLGLGEAGWVVVTGGPGMGKSAVLSAWLGRREAAGAVVPHHFVRRQVIDWDQPERIAASLAAQIEAMFPELRDPAARPEGRLIELLGRVSKRLGPSGNLVVLVDGLDETRVDPGDNPLPRFLPHEVPPGIRLLCAMRPTYPHLNWIEARNPARRVDLDDRQWAESNEAVVRGFWEAVAPEYKPPLPAETRTAAIERAEGNVLHAVMLHDALQGVPARERRADRIPRGLRGLIGDIWNRAASDENVRVALGLLCAAQEALSLDVLTELAGWSYNERERFVPSARQLLLEEPASWAGALAYRPRHDWVRELMAERLGEGIIRAHHETLARKLATWPVPLEATARRYTLRHAIFHRAEAGEWANAWRLAADMGFIEAKCRELGAHEAEVDMARTAERCRASGDETLRGRFDDLARALGRESHWLQDVPEATAALVWNRLHRSGWSADEIDQHLQLPVGAAFLRVRHIATRESLALVRDFVGHASGVTACVVTPDCRRVVSASDDKTLKVWDLESGRNLATLEGHTFAVTACVVIPDGRRVVSASDDKTLKVWDLESGRNLATLQGHADRVNACAVTPDGRRVVSASDDQTLKVWDLESGRNLATLRGHAARVTVCAVIPDGRRVISASFSGQTLKVWDLESRRSLMTLEGHADGVTACAVTPDGRRVVSASFDQTLKVWDLKSGRPVATLRGHAATVTACAVTPDGERVVSASRDNTLKVWDLKSGRNLATVEGHAIQVVMTPDGRHVVSVSDNHTLKVWDLKSGRNLAILEGHAAWVTACAVAPDGRRVVSASRDNTLKVWDLESRRPVATLGGHTARVNAYAVTPDGGRVVSASDDNTLKVWDLKSGRPLTTLQGHDFRVRACAVTPDGQRVVSASADNTLKMWDLESGSAVATLQGHTTSVTACAVTPDGRRVVSASDDQTLKVWDLKSGRPLATHTVRVTAFFVTPDGVRVVSVYWDKKFKSRTLKVWDLESERILATLQSHTASVNACVVTPDGRRMVLASDDSTLKIWDLESGRILVTLQGHTASVNACAVTPDGRCAVSVSDDNTLKVWDLESHACLFTHRGDTSYSAVTTTATTIVAGDAAGTVWFFDLPSPNIAAAYKQGCAAISLRVAGDRVRGAPPVRAGIDASKLILAADPVEPQARRAGASTASPSQPGRTGTNPATPPKVDIGILTIRDDEFRAVLDVFPSEAGIAEGKNRKYPLRRADIGNGQQYTLAVLRQVGQGQVEAQAAARDLIEDLAPKLMLVVGIAGGLPSDDVKLGDVVLSTRIQDFSVEARKYGKKTEYAVKGGPVVRSLAADVAILEARGSELGNWAADLPSQPEVNWTRKGQLYGPPEWRRDLRAKLEHHYGEGSMPRAPRFFSGPIASSDRLVKDPDLVIPWLATSRDLLAIEMESGGVYHAAQNRCPMLAIRGISDIVGLKRAEAWTKYACASAAAFTRAYLRTRPVVVDAGTGRG